MGDWVSGRRGEKEKGLRFKLKVYRLDSPFEGGQGDEKRQKTKVKRLKLNQVNPLLWKGQGWV